MVPVHDHGPPLPVDILLVDDRPENLLALHAILEDEPGYRLVDAASGAEALRALLTRDFSLILLDARLPEMDGFEVAALIKQRERTRDIPILFLTASGADQDTIRRAYAVGAADYLVKPILAEIVKAKVTVFVELARKTEQLSVQAGLLQEAERRQQALELADLKTASERRYRHLAESIPQLVWRAMPDGRLEYWNQRWTEYTGAHESLPPGGAWSFVHPEDRQKSQPLWEEALRDGAPFQCECRLLHHSGVYRWHLRRALPETAREGEVLSWLGTDTDIDDRKRADDERIELLVRERAARYEAEAAQKRAAQLYIEAREAVQVRDDFLTVAAHELRTPLTSLRLQAQHQVRGETPSPAALAMNRSVERLCRLVDQLLDVSRVAGGQVPLQLERADLRVVVEETAGRLRQEAESNGCSVSVARGGPVPAEFDPLRIEQVVTNLLTNAIKYGRGKPVEVEVESGGGAARLVVRDQGIGVASGDAARIFERFGRAVSVREYGGLGLGLYISRQIVEAHGGTINVASEPGKGATFLVEFPLVRAAQAGETRVH
jgi:PAS domain S-box-containing protein